MGIFAKLHEEEAQQKKRLAEAETEQIFPQAVELNPTQHAEHEHEPPLTPEVAHPTEQPVILPPTLPTADAVELLTFKTRRSAKVKVNAEVPVAWKSKLDAMAYQLKVGKYELLAYIIGEFLDEV